MRIKSERGQLLVGAVVMLIILAILVPVMVKFVQNEAKWSVKEKQNTGAFHLADAALERAVLKVTESTTTWANIQGGGAGIPTGFKFDQSYSDLAGGTYAISVSSGPQAQQVTVITVARDSTKKESRGLKAVYTNLTMTSALYGGNGVTVNDGLVEWGSVISPKDLSTGGQSHPQFYSSGNITPQDANGAAPPNTDGVQWWSYYAGVPAAPNIDFAAYKSSAQATGTYFDEGIPGVTPPNNTTPCGDLNGVDNQLQGYTWYFNCPTQGVHLTSNGNAFITGTMIVIGNFSIDASAANGNYNASIPPAAWKQYGGGGGNPPAAWTYFRTKFDPGGIYGTPPTFPTSAGYLLPAMTFNVQNVIVKGFLYVSGDASFGTGGSGRTQVHGSAYIVGNVTMVGGSLFEVYYDQSSAQNMLLSRIVVARNSWQDVNQKWPSGLP